MLHFLVGYFIKLLKSLLVKKMKVLLASCILLSLYITQVEPTFTTGNCPVIPLIRNIDFSRVFTNLL